MNPELCGDARAKRPESFRPARPAKAGVKWGVEIPLLTVHTKIVLDRLPRPAELVESWRATKNKAQAVRAIDPGKALKTAVLRLLHALPNESR